ncbi:MAG TPA: DUF4870 domain-containing protein [Anaerolineales bacterium]
MNTKPSTEERIWAVIAHLSAIAVGMGIFLPVLGWSQSRRKSNYTALQCLQALGYQTLGYTIWILTTLIVMVISVLGFASSIQSIDTIEADLTTWAIGHSAFTFGLIALYFILPVSAAIACAFGMDFRYPVMGKRLARYLGYDAAHSAEGQVWLIEENEDRWVTSMGHFAVIIVLWGLLVPVFAWVLQGKRSLFLKIQSIQAVVYQAGTMLLYFVAGFLYVFGLLVFIFTIGFRGEVVLDSSSSMIGAIVFLVSLLIAALILLAVPLLHILGQWAGYRVLKGDEYHYPIVGRLVEKWISRKTKSSSEETSA